MNEEEYEKTLERIFEFIGTSVVPGSKEDEELAKLCDSVQGYQDLLAQETEKDESAKNS